MSLILFFSSVQGGFFCVGKKQFYWLTLLPARSFTGGLYAEAAEAPQAAAVASVQGIEQVTVISKSYGDGELPAYVVLKYPHSLDSKQLAAADYTVEGRTVEKVTTNTEPTAEKDVPGCYVVLHLAHTNTSFDGDLAARAKQDAAQAGQADAAGDDKGGKGVDAPWIADRQPPDLTVKVSQVKDVKAQDGTVYAASSQAHSDSGVVEQDVDRFTQHVYKDPETGCEMPYNLYLPKDYDPNKSYPLVFFVADARVNINNTKTPLFQGNGATVWTEPEAQAKHPWHRPCTAVHAGPRPEHRHDDDGRERLDAGPHVRHAPAAGHDRELRRRQDTHLRHGLVAGRHDEHRHQRPLSGPLCRAVARRLPVERAGDGRDEGQEALDHGL